jgi:hypothetical protein
LQIVSLCLTMTDVPIRRTYTFRIDDDLIEGLQVVWERDGIGIPEQIRRAVRAWLELKGVKVKPASRRTQTRRKA